MAVGLTLLFDLIQRSSSLISHYTDWGVLPRSELFRLWNEPAFISVYNLNASAIFTGTMFIVAGIFAVMLIVGWRSKLASIVSFILLISLHNRNPLVLQGGDVALRVIMFWMMFLPLGKRMSWDIMVGKVKYAHKNEDYFDIPGVAYIVQFFLIWTFSGFLKVGLPWTETYTAVGMALSLDTFTTSIGRWLRNFPAMLSYLTMITLAIERFTWITFLSPVKSGWFRLLGLVLLNGLVIGFNLSFRLGLFGMIMVSISLGLLPRVFWDKIIFPIRMYLSNRSTPGFTIFYDGDCGFCSKISNSISKVLFLHPTTMVVMADTDTDAKIRMHNAHSWVIRDNYGRSYTGFRAFVSLMSSSSVFKFIAPIFLIRPIFLVGEEFYRMVANNPMRVCVVEPVDPAKIKSQKDLRIVRNYAVSFILILVIMWNVKTLPNSNHTPLPNFLEKILLIARLDQKWNMFAPYPTTEDGFYVIPGTLRDGSVVDVYSGRPYVSYEKPQYMAWMYKDQRWQKYMMNLWLKSFSNYRLGYAQYLCRSWNAKNTEDKQLMNFSIVYVLEVTDMNNLEEGPLIPTTIWQHECFKN